VVATKDPETRTLGLVIPIMENWISIPPVNEPVILIVLEPVFVHAIPVIPALLEQVTGLGGAVISPEGNSISI